MATPAITALERAGQSFTVHTYDGESLDESLSYGEAVAQQLGVSGDRLFKTLISEVGATLVVGIVPAARSLDLKALAAALGEKRASMADPSKAERGTGYVTGGISPFGQRKRLPVVVDESAFDFDRIYVSGGKRGLQLEIPPQALITVLKARTAAISQ